MELEYLLKEKQEVIASFVGSSVISADHSIFPNLATPHALSPVMSTSASRSFDISGAAGDIDPFILSDRSSVSGVFEEGFIGGIPTELGNRP